jgi:hypothetical protein
VISNSSSFWTVRLLQGTPHKDWTVTEMSWFLSMDSPCVSAHLHAFAKNAMVVATEEEKGWRYRFDPANSDIAEAIGTLAKIYSQHKWRIRTIIRRD